MDRPPANYQTVKLSRGKHATPQHGACVMELASMIAGEPFSDHPSSVCPVIGAFLRAYNDTIGYRRRQDLYRLAALVVGTRSSADVQRRRIGRCLAWGREMRGGRNWLHRRLPPRLVPEGPTSADAAGSYAARAIIRPSDHTHAQALALIEELCAITSDPAPAGDVETGSPAPAATEWRQRDQQHA